MLGSMFLLRDSLRDLRYWWVLFLLIPVIVLWANAWTSYQRSGGRLTSSVVDPIIGGLLLATIIVIYLFDADWTTVGPVLAIIVGIGLLLRTWLTRPA
jgi:hypothetical protein